MIPTNTQIWLVAGVTDMRRGFTSLSSLVQSMLDKSPLSGQVFIFRGRRGDLVKLIWHDGDGMCLFQKRLDRGRFVWPQATSGTVSLTRGTTVDVVRGHRLAAAGADVATADGGVSYSR